MKCALEILVASAACLFPRVQSVTTLNSLARDIFRVESVRSIKDIQRNFAQFAQFGRYDGMASLFSSDGTLQWGNVTATGLSAIENTLRTDAGKMNGINPGSLDTMVVETPLINLSVDGKSAKGRWNGLRFQGDGQGGTRIQGGIYENEYILTKDGWKISYLHYYAMYIGPYKGGWRNVGGKGIPIIPYHFTPEDSGIPIPTPVGDAEQYGGSIDDLDSRITRLNDEDEVRNLMHAHGYYVDRRMWTDAVDLHSLSTTVVIRNDQNYTGKLGVRKALERMGPEGLTQGINNDHPIFDMIVDVDPNGRDAVARGIEVAMIGNVNNKTASWEFNVFRNSFVKEMGQWKIKTVDTTPLIVADYFKGWDNGGLKPANTYLPGFLNITRPKLGPTTGPMYDDLGDLDDLQRRLNRSAAYDGAENQSTAYGYLLDDLDCAGMGALFAKRGHKASPFAGFYITPERVTQACFASWGTNLSTLRTSISFHWRPQPVILVSDDGRSATLRARLLQPSTSATKAGSFNNAIYHDQMVFEDGKWRLWSVTIDEFYWESSSWEGGWSTVKPRNASDSGPATWTKNYPPDLTLARTGERESTFRGGNGRYIEWPDIQRMWFQYRNPVNGRTPEFFWPGCVPCRAMPDWALEENGYQEPASGPTISFPFWD